uniref:Uncharacterized protein n=1 Tax=Octopus bimaculoides TaxID=37653 RepID=A0A0L8GE06_OCTBM
MKATLYNSVLVSNTVWQYDVTVIAGSIYRRVCVWVQFFFFTLNYNSVISPLRHYVTA